MGKPVRVKGKGKDGQALRIGIMKSALEHIEEIEERWKLGEYFHLKSAQYVLHQVIIWCEEGKEFADGRIEKFDGLEQLAAFLKREKQEFKEREEQSFMVLAGLTERPKLLRPGDTVPKDMM